MLPKTVFFRYEQQEEKVFQTQTNKQEQTNSRNKSLHLPSSASCASKPSKADLSLHSDEQEKVFHIQGLPQEKTREQTNPQNKSLPSSASHASKPSKPIYLFIQ